MSLGDDGAYGGGEYGGQGPAGQTRTRLPGSEGDVYGTGRRPRGGMSSRNLVTIVGVVVLLIAAIAFANRGGTDSTSDSANPDSGAPAAQPTTPTGERPVSDKNGPVPSGFPKTEQGAQSAAANYSVALAGDGMYESEERDAIVDAVYTPSTAAARKESLRKVYADPEFLGRIGLKADGSAPEGMTFVSRVNPVGTKIEKFDGSTAKVAVWYSSLFGLAGEGSENPVAESWYTTTMQLQWVEGDWKIADLTQKKGPAPVGRDQAAATAEEMSKAVEGFGGFTYAR